MNKPTSTPEHDEAQTILDALRQIQDDPELQAEARRTPNTVLDRLNLSGIARTAVTLGIAGLTVAAHGSRTIITPDAFWVS